MTVAYNLSQLANRVNSSGQLDASTGLINSLPAISGASLTNLNASALASGTVPFARLPVGSILQIDYNTSQTKTTTTSSSYIDATGVTQTITPTATSSMIVLNWSINMLTDAYDVLGISLQYQVLRNSTVIHNSNFAAFGSVQQSNVPIVVLDTPSSTSAVIYKLQFRRVVTYGSTGNSVAINNDTGYPSTSTMIIQELKG